MHHRAIADRTRAIVVVLAVWLLTPFTEGAAAPSGAPSLFDVTAAVVGRASGPLPRTAVRQRHANARRDLLTTPDGSPAIGVGERLVLNLFHDVSFTMTVNSVARHPGNGLTWTGALDGTDLGHAALALHDGALAGVVVLPGAVYRIGHTPDGTQVVEEIDPAALPPEADARTPASPADAAMRLGGESADVATDSAAQLDVMVLYTAAARTAAGGTAAMLAEVNLAVALANEAYANNNLVQRVRLVFSGEVSITEGDFFADVDSLALNPTVDWLRNGTRADLVSLITDHGPFSPFCGIGFLMNTNSTAFAQFGFNVVERDCASANLSLVHELGHNMGAHHDPLVTGGQATLFPYSHGYVDVVGHFRTIMAYADQCSNAGVACPRIPFFSTPLLTHDGRPLGNAATSDNARTLSQTANTVANFRTAFTSPLTPATGVNQPAFTVGETLLLSVGLGNPGGTGAFDVYVGVLLPDGATALFVTDPTVPGIGPVAFGNVFDLASYPRFATGVQAGSPLPATLSSFAAHQWDGGEPGGGYVFFVLAVSAGALQDGVLTTNELLDASLTPFSFLPPGGSGGCPSPCKGSEG